MVCWSGIVRLPPQLALHVDSALTGHGEPARQVVLRLPQPGGVLELPGGVLEAQVEELLARVSTNSTRPGSSKLCTSAAFITSHPVRPRASRTWASPAAFARPGASPRGPAAPAPARAALGHPRHAPAVLLAVLASLRGQH